MDLTEKRDFIVQLMTNVMKEAIVKAKDMPEEWDGLELREYLADKLDESRYMSKNCNKTSHVLKRRLKDYKNAMIVTNL